MFNDKKMNQDYKQQPDCKEFPGIPGSFGLPLLGHMIDFVKDLRGMTERNVLRYGSISRININNNKGLLITGPELMQEILLDKNRNFSNEMAYKNTLGRFFEGGILLKDFDEHKMQRRIFQNAFKNDAMRTYVEHMNNLMRVDIESWETIPDFVFFPPLKKTLLTTAARIFAGVERGSRDFDRLYQDYIDLLEGITSLIHIELPWNKWGKAHRARRDIYACFGDLIPQRRAANGTDFLTFFSKETKDDGSFFSDEEIVRHMNFLVFAAHDTTTASIINLAYELALNPQWQEHLRQVCVDYAAQTGKTELSYDDLEEIPDLEYAMLEGQRMHPSVPMAARRSIRAMELGGYHIPPNTLMWLPYVAFYRSEKYWTNPNQFDPHRFAPGREEHKAHSFLFIPFGGGAHKCIGMHFAKIQVKCFFYLFLQRYRFTVPENYHPWLMMVPMPKPADGLPLKLERIL